MASKSNGAFELRATENFAELDEFIKVLLAENVRSYLEIGSCFGDSFWRVADALPVPSRLVSVDKVVEPLLTVRINDARRRGHNADMIVGDSTAPEIVEKIKSRAPFDACFIDANHTLSYVTADWEAAKSICRIVAFHDIGWQPNAKRSPIDVPQLWNELKSKFRHQEIRHYHQKNGIGILWT